MRSISKLFAVCLLVFSAGTAMAGVEKFDSDEFNSIISDNLKAEKELREQLRANAGVPDLKKEMNPDFSEKGRQLVGVVEAESVASPTSDYTKRSKDRSSKRLLEKNMKRVSQEIRDSEL